MWGVNMTTNCTGLTRGEFRFTWCSNKKYFLDILKTTPYYNYLTRPWLLIAILDIGMHSILWLMQCFIPHNFAITIAPIAVRHTRISWYHAYTRITHTHNHTHTHHTPHTTHHARIMWCTNFLSLFTHKTSLSWNAVLVARLEVEYNLAEKSRNLSLPCRSMYQTFCSLHANKQANIVVNITSHAMYGTLWNCFITTYMNKQCLILWQLIILFHLWLESHVWCACMAEILVFCHSQTPTCDMYTSISYHPRTIGENHIL